MKTLALAVGLLAPLPQDAPAPPPSREIGEHEGSIRLLAASPDGAILVTVAERELHAWDVGKDRLLWQTTVPVPLVALGVGKELVAHHFGFAAVGFHELESGRERSGVGGTTAGQESACLAIDPEDRWVWMGTSEGLVTRVVPDDVDGWSNRKLENGGVTCMAMDADGKTLAVGGKDATVRFVGAKSANVDDKKVLEGHGGAVSAVAMDPKGSLVVSASEAGDLRVWKFSSAKQQHLLQESGSPARHVAIDPKGKLAASGHADGTILVWSLGKGELLAKLPAAHEGAVTGLAFVGKGTTLAASWESPRVTLWDLAEL